MVFLLNPEGGNNSSVTSPTFVCGFTFLILQGRTLCFLRGLSRSLAISSPVSLRQGDVAVPCQSETSGHSKLDPPGGGHTAETLNAEVSYYQTSDEELK